MVGHELGVEQQVAAALQPLDQRHQRDLAGVAPVREHALAEERGAERDAVEAADQAPLGPGLDAVGVALPVQRAVEPDQVVVEPGAGPLRARLGAGLDDRAERAVDPDLEGWRRISRRRLFG